MQLAFGSGSLWGNRTDTTGSGIGPVEFAILQGASVDWTFETRPLRGQYQYPVDHARGAGTITVRATFARIFGAIYGDLFFGISATTAGTIVSYNETGTVPASITYTITVTQAATYAGDLGVYYAAGANAGRRFKSVTTPAAAGEYTVNTSTGVYTFASADASAAVLISYYYTRSTGSRIAITNKLSGETPTFKAILTNAKTTQGTAHSADLVLNACTSNRLSLPFKMDDYMIEEFEFSAFADAAGNVGTLSVNE